MQLLSAFHQSAAQCGAELLQHAHHGAAQGAFPASPLLLGVLPLPEQQDQRTAIHPVGGPAISMYTHASLLSAAWCTPAAAPAAYDASL